MGTTDTIPFGKMFLLFEPLAENLYYSFDRLNQWAISFFT